MSTVNCSPAGRESLSESRARSAASLNDFLYIAEATTETENPTARHGG